MLDGRSSWTALNSVLKILVEDDADRIFVVCNNGMSLIYDAMNMLHMMYHEATACHVSGELIELIQAFQVSEPQLSFSTQSLNILLVFLLQDLIKAVRAAQRNSVEHITQVLARWKDMADMTGRLLTLCNSYTPQEMRDVCVATVKEMLRLWPTEMLNILVPSLHRAHSTANYGGAGNASGEGSGSGAGIGPYFPRRNKPNVAGLAALKNLRPPRPMLQMSVPAGQLDAPHGQDPEYDIALTR